MYCLGCAYELVGLDEGRCPECGRAFNADDDGTFRTAEHMKRALQVRQMKFGLIALALVPWMAHAFALVALIVARFSLGRWPHRGGADDPKGIAGIELPGEIAFFLLAVSLWVTALLPALFVGLMLSLVIMKCQTRTRLLGGVPWGVCLWAGGLWVCGLALMYWDPAQAWYWLFD